MFHLILVSAIAAPQPEQPPPVVVMPAPIICTKDKTKCAAVIRLPEKTILVPIPVLDLFSTWSQI